jgi:hypothetical protein
MTIRDALVTIAAYDGEGSGGLHRMLAQMVARYPDTMKKLSAIGRGHPWRRQRILNYLSNQRRLVVGMR